MEGFSGGGALMRDIEKIHKANQDIEPCRHEVIWNLFRKYKFYIRIDDIKADFIPYVPYPPKLVYMCKYIENQFKWYYFIKKRGIFESLFIIEDELRRRCSDGVY